MSMQCMILRIAERKDVPALSYLDHEWKKESVSPGFKPRTRPQFAKAIANDLVIIAEKDGSIVGYALGTVKKSAGNHVEIDQDVLHLNAWGRTKAYIDIDSLYVLKRHRLNGIGKLLMKRLLAETKHRGVHKILLAADNKENPDKLAEFYRSLGFRTVVTYLEKEI